jgi:hypothetical protein
MRRRALFMLSVGLVGGGALVAATASRAGAATEFTVLGHTTNVEFVTAAGGSAVPKGPLAPGDRIVLRQDLSRNGILAGYSNIVCTVTFNDNALCDGILAITNKGDIHVTGLLRGAVSHEGVPKVFDSVVNGGTFAYRNAHGDVHTVVLPNGDQMSSVVLP